VLGVPLSQLSSLTVDLHDLLGRAAEELGTRVHAARDGTAAVRAAATFVTQRIASGSTIDATVERTLDAIATDGGTHSIAALEGWRGRSRARFATAFRDRVGVSPKRFARIVRFDRALRAIAERRGTSLGEIALAAGYYDQAHFTNEFREHAGLTPRAYVCATAGTTSLLDAGEHFFQDAAS
jgi:AraC-like DNA-binding protein